jgi:flagellar FliL protein
MADEKEKPRMRDSEAAEQQPVEETPAKKRSFIPPMKYLIIAGVVIVQIAASYFLQKALFFSDVAEAGLVTSQEAVEGHAEGDEQSGEQLEEPVIVMLEEVIVNPAGTEGRRYLATRLGLQTRSMTGEEEISSRAILIRDAVISLLSSKSMTQLSDLAYRDTLRAELRDVVNLQLKDTHVDNVVFSDYVLN